MRNLYYKHINVIKSYYRHTKKSPSQEIEANT